MVLIWKISNLYPSDGEEEIYTRNEAEPFYQELSQQRGESRDLVTDDDDTA